MHPTADEHQAPIPQGSDAKKGIAVVIASLIACAILYQILPYEPMVKKGLVLLVFVGILWLTEAINVTLTALSVPIGAALLGINNFTHSKTALASFADPIIFIFFGGFALATALHVQKLDRKIAFWIMSMSKSHLGIASALLFSATAAISMWISNTATAAMMLPLALGIMSHLDEEKDKPVFIFILLGIAYSASIGGLGTLVGSPPNAIAAKALDMDFNEWMKMGIPLVLVLMPLMMVTLWLVFKPNLNRKIEVPHEHIPWSQRRVLAMILFLVTAACWVNSKELSAVLGIKSLDSMIAVTAAILVGTLGLASWHQISDNTDWGVLLLFGGGLALSSVMKDSGASAVLGDVVAKVLTGTHPLVVILGVTSFIVILTEFTSNTASAALLVPVFAAIGERMGMPPSVLVMMIGIGASCAFMLPVATPPNAIVYGTGKITQGHMLKAGAFLNAACIIVLTIWGYFFLN